MLFSFLAASNGLHGINVKKLRISKYPNLVFPQKDVYHCRIGIQISANVPISIYSGLSPSISIAIKKAFSEMCEGIFLKDLSRGKQFNRSGVSCHLTREEAVQKSYDEIIERDSFLMHFLNPELKTVVLNSLEYPDFEVRVIELQSIDNQTRIVSTAIIDKKAKFWFIGLSSGGKTQYSTEELISKSYYESIMLYYNWSSLRFKKNNNKLLEDVEAHLISSAEKKNSLALETIFKAIGNKELPFQKDTKNLKIINQKKLRNRHIILGEIPETLKLEFGKKWIDNQNYYKKIMKKRGLKMEHWGLHPLM